ncbi:MAG: MarR family transcriptional regulator [Odoribacter splanchnicus]|nr:MarR family transcriptional regulator [Odoribacter splanchnicus]
MENLCRIRNIQRAVAGFESQFEKRYGICLNEGMALCSLHQAGSLSSGEIGELLGLTSSNTSKVIRSIENKGLIERILGMKDKRQMYFSLTPRGKELISSVKCNEIEFSPLLANLLESMPDSY